MKKLLTLSILLLSSSAIAEDAKPTQNYFLGNLDVIKSGGVAVAPLVEERTDEDKEDGKEKKRKKNEKAVNYAFIKLDSGEVKWVSPTNSQKFLFRKEVKDKDSAPEEGKRKGSAKVRANVYAVVTADSDKDGSLTEKDKISVAISGPAGGGYKVLVTDIDELFDIDSSEEGRVAAIYRKGGKLARAVIDVDGFKVIAEGPLPEIK